MVTEISSAIIEIRNPFKRKVCSAFLMMSILLSAQTASSTPSETNSNLAHAARQSCSEVLEAGLDPVSLALKLSDCVEKEGTTPPQLGDHSNNRLLGRSDPGEDIQHAADVCSEDIRSAVESYIPYQGITRDTLIIEHYGTGRRQKLVLPGIDTNLICADCAYGARRTFPLQDQTHIFSTSDSMLTSGRYAAQLLPADRHKFLIPHDLRDEIDTGSKGAIILWKMDERNSLPIVIHTGKADSRTLYRLPSLLVDERLMDLLIGSILALRSLELGPSKASTWRERAPLAGWGNCRLPTFAPFQVHVRPTRYNLLRSWFGERYGRHVRHFGQKPIELKPVTVSWEAIERAQITTGMTPSQFRELADYLLAQLNSKSAAIKVALDTNLLHQERISRVMALDTETRELIIDTTIVLEGLHSSLAEPEFLEEDWGIIRLLENSTLKLDESLQNNIEQTLKPIDDAVVNLWLRSSQGEGPLSDCNASPIENLDPVEKMLPDISPEIEVAGRSFTLKGRGTGKFWFVPVPAKPNIYRLNASFRYEVDSARALHQEVSNHLLPEKSCQSRFFIENLDQIINQNALSLRSQGRAETWHCGWFKYPCGVSLKGTKSCRKDIKTRLLVLGFERYHQANASAQGSIIGVRLTGPDTDEKSGFEEDIDQFPDVAHVVVTSGLTATEARFLEFDRRIWLGAEFRGEVNLSRGTACNLATMMRGAK